ncbi:MAG: dTDP-4-dehydrorhamnose 3,5-epimerase [bacterium]|nr:dTDP-4-dehydrorhamnose 3,5-epimerase [bacterium]
MQPFKFQESKLNGAYLITAQYADDNRGGLIKDYNIETYRSHGINHCLKEVFYTISKKGVIRALHFQEVKQQAKLVRCIKGEIYDVIVDLRKESRTYRQWQGVLLNEENKQMVYIPRYFAHGYLVLKDSIVSYQCDEVFYSEYDTGIRWNDPEIAVEWPVDRIGGMEHLILSDKDLKLPYLKEYEERG